MWYFFFLVFLLFVQSDDVILSSWLASIFSLSLSPVNLLTYRQVNFVPRILTCSFKHHHTVSLLRLIPCKNLMAKVQVHAENEVQFYCPPRECCLLDKLKIYCCVVSSIHYFYVIFNFKCCSYTIAILHKEKINLHSISSSPPCPSSAFFVIFIGLWKKTFKSFYRLIKTEFDEGEEVILYATQHCLECV